MQLVKVDESLKENSRYIDALQQFPLQELNLEPQKVSTSLISKFTGISKIEKIEQRFVYAVRQMRLKINDYEKGVEATNKVVVEFIKFRNELNVEYRKAISELKLILGEKFKTIPPDLFDFSKINYLDGKEILKQISSDCDIFCANAAVYKREISLDFRKKMEKAGKSSYSDFSESFSLSAQGVLTTDKTKKKEAFFEAGYHAVVGGLKCFGALVEHHLEVRGKALVLEEEYEKFKENASSSYVAMTKDTVRIGYIRRNIEEVFIPRSKIFIDNFENVYSNEYASLTSSIYSSPTAKNLKNQNDDLYKELNKKNNDITSAEYELTKKENEKQKNQGIIKEETPTYKFAKKKQPFLKSSIFVFVLVSVLFFFTRNLSNVCFVINIICMIVAIIFIVKSALKYPEWKKIYGKFCKKYREKKNLIKILENEICLMRHSVNELKVERKLIESNIQTNVNSMLSTISVNDSIREKFVIHLENIVSLLKTGKMILESKFEDSILNPEVSKNLYVYENNFNNSDVSTKIKTSFNNEFIKGAIANRLNESQEINRKLLISKFEIHDDDKEEVKIQKQEELKKAIADLEKNYKRYKEISFVSLDVFTNTTENLIDCFHELVKLNELKINSRINEQKYQFEYENFQNKFGFYFNKLNDDINELRQTNEQILTENNYKVKLDLLTSLCGYTELSQDEIEDFLKGKSNLVV